jgi:Peptidase family M28
VLSRSRRARRGSLERPVSTRLYRAAWGFAAVPVLVAAFTVVRPTPLTPPRLEPTFDQTTAAAFASELARRFPDRLPGSAGAAAAADWVVARFRDVGLKAERETFTADLPDLGRVELTNLIAIAPGRSPETIVVMAHRDNAGDSPGVNDNASGTGALLELARDAQGVPAAHTLVFLSTDGGGHGGAGAARFASHPELLDQIVGNGASIVAVINLDAIARSAPARLLFAGEAARSPAPALLATAEERIAQETGSVPRRPRALSQLIDLGFPFTLHEQGPFVAEGIPAVTVTTGPERPPASFRDTLEAFRPARLGALGRSAHAVVLSLDDTAERARGTQPYVYVGERLLRGWTIQFSLLAAVIPFLVATVDLFARCRRRHVPLAPALRSLASRIGVWIWAGALFALFSVAGLLADGGARPIDPDSATTTTWPVGTLLTLLALSLLAWLVVRPRLAPRRPVERADELGGHLAAMLVLAVVALVVAATNPFSLLFLLPSLHAWLWLPHLRDGHPAGRLALYAAGFAGPLLLVTSFAVRFQLGLDAPWYLAALVSVGYVAPPLALAALVWGAVAGQLGALALGRYAPYPERGQRPVRGPIRAVIRTVVLAARRRRRYGIATAPEPGAEPLERE